MQSWEKLPDQKLLRIDVDPASHTLLRHYRSQVMTRRVYSTLMVIGVLVALGFAIGILTSMFTALVGSRTLIHLIWGRQRKLESLSI
mgnify:CR=1 FL=1